MITIKKKEDYIKYLHLQYADTQEPLDLTGCSVYSQMRNKPGGTLACTGVCSMDAEKGDIWVKFLGANTADLTPGEYGFDIWIIDGDNNKHPIYTTRCQIVDRYTDNF